MRPGSPESAGPRTGLARSVLCEVAARLAALASSGESSAIDLRSLPMTPADRSELEQYLGRGDVSASLSVAGRSELWETRYCGVWWLRHFGAHEQIAAERLEITAVPEILMAHGADIAAAAARVRAELAGPGAGAESDPHG